MKILHSKIDQLIDSEIERVTEEYNSADIKDKIVIDGALTELSFLKENSEHISRDWLLKRHTHYRKKKSEAKLLALFDVNLKRKKQKMAIIVIVGKKLNEIIDSNKDK